ncbi:MAG TPA: hypothetical protein VIK32_17230, partial [Candidatus Limnocylindrales bacterium]
GNDGGHGQKDRHSGMATVVAVDGHLGDGDVRRLGRSAFEYLPGHGRPRDSSGGGKGVTLAPPPATWATKPRGESHDRMIAARPDVSPTAHLSVGHRASYTTGIT